MVEQAKRTLAYICPECRQSVVIERTAFQLAAAGSELPCPCGKSARAKGAFLDELVMHEVLSEIRDIAQRDGISCTCGSQRWNLQVNYSSVDLKCADCGGAMRIPAATASDIEDICCKYTLLIHGREGAGHDGL